MSDTTTPRAHHLTKCSKCAHPVLIYSDATALILSVRQQAVRYVVRPDVAVAMPDGVVLLGDHYRPAGDYRPLPVVLIRSPYGRAGLPGMVFAAPLARRGFQVFIQSTRGTFGSGGLFRPFTCEREDGLATVAWLRGCVSSRGATGRRR